MSSGRGSTRVDHGRLSQDDERTLWVCAAPYGGFGCSHFLARAAHVDRASPNASLGLPGDWPLQRPVDLEDAGPVFEAGQLASILRRQAGARDAQYLAGSEVEQCCSVGWQLFKPGD